VLFRNVGEDVWEMGVGIMFLSNIFVCRTWS